ncbi:winged helix-turn-helix transcriptional regulator [Alkalibaculum bacchi]|nr:helix-turn-helix domain-containing protein [Alkalibaculum bacchi]
MQSELQYGSNAGNRYDFKITQKVLAGKWKNILIWNIHLHKNIRFNKFKKFIPDITTKMLSQELKFLCDHDIVEKTIYNYVPPMVVYSLTERGKSLVPILVAMNQWGIHNKDILENKKES